MTGSWRIEYSGDRFERFLRKLPEYEQAVAVAAIERVLAVEGLAICESDWGKALGNGLYEFRVRKALSAFAGPDVGGDRKAKRPVLLRMFCTFHGDRVVLLLGGYDKKRDPSKKRQAREIDAARKELAQWERAARGH
ncbi:MAG: hypothetical protein CVT64_11365 [Actinobacteria bacterium HGW-Actinobacteria-4]|nr:MAG: hypothetical protein CVT64_11365 [Actinobacteria bacterium HGW-Actinobacteria-4]